MGSRGGAVRMHRSAFVGAFRQDRPANDRIARRHQHSFLRRDGASDSLVAIQRLPNDFVYSVVHHSRRIRNRASIRVPGPHASARFMARCDSRWRNWWSIHFCLLRGGVPDYRPADQVIERCKIRIVHRIVSLLPAATEMAAALELMDQVVGVSHECDFPEQASQRPRVTQCPVHDAGLTSVEVDEWVRRALGENGTIYTIDEPLLRTLQPNVILTQRLCDVCAVGYGTVAKLAQTLPGPPRVVNLEPTSLA